MRKTFALLLTVLLVLSLGAAPKVENAVTLTADQVTSARDIEQAIIQATAGGTRPGTVVLDSSAGDFVYAEGADRSINIFYSDITLTSPNDAAITNCDDGVFFDFDLHNVIVEGITFNCNGLGVSLWATGADMRSISIRKNTFTTGSFGIEVVGVHDFELANNLVTSAWTGLRLENVTNGRVTANVIFTDGTTGIDLSGASTGNQIHGNRVTCADPTFCVAVFVFDESLWTMNNIEGNPVK
jgi:nitrous oxidase accessory protein NosD